MTSWKLIQFLPDQGRWRNQLRFFFFFFTLRVITQKLCPNLVYPLLWISFDVVCEQLRTARIKGVLLIR